MPSREDSSEQDRDRTVRPDEAARAGAMGADQSKAVQSKAVESRADHPGVAQSRAVRNRTARDAARDDQTVATVARVHGRVQGVGYRYWAATNADYLRLRGYVRNLTDGTVEALLIGDRIDVARMLVLCEEGPEAAEVVKVESGPPPGETPLGFDRFRRMRTANPGEPV